MIYYHGKGIKNASKTTKTVADSLEIISIAISFLFFASYRNEYGNQAFTWAKLLSIGHNGCNSEICVWAWMLNAAFTASYSDYFKVFIFF